MCGRRLSFHALRVKPLLTIHPAGCLDSLVYYKRLLVRLLEAEGDATLPEREKLNLACFEMLEKLEEVDPMRRARYRDLSASLRLFLGSSSLADVLEFGQAFRLFLRDDDVEPVLVSTFTCTAGGQ